MSAHPIEQLEGRRLFSTFTVNAAGGADYADLDTAIAAVPAGSTISVAPGTYTAHPTSLNPTQSIFYIPKSLTIVSTGGSAATVLVIPAGQPQGIVITAPNTKVQGFTVNGGLFGVFVDDFITDTNLTNVTLRDLVVNPVIATNAGHGVLFENVSDSLIDGCTVGLSYANGIMLDGGSDDDVVVDNSVAGTVTQHAIAVKNSSDDQILDNTVLGSAFDGIFLTTGSGCTITGNSVSGQTVDGITMTSDSDDNTVRQNTVTSNGVAAGRPNGAGVWMNDESDRNVVADNVISGQPECGIDVFVSSDELITGNDVFGNGQGGIFLYDCLEYPTSVGGAPTNCVVTDNYIHDNLANSGVILRGAHDTTVTGNAITGTYTGTAGGDVSYGGLEVQRSTDTRFADNTLMGLSAGLYVYATTSNLSVYDNRFLSVTDNFVYTGATVSFDGGAGLGGNYWSDETGRKPYTNFVYDTAGHRGGGFADSGTFADQSLGQAYAATVTAPLAGTTMATGSRRAITWSAPAAARVDILYTSAETGDVTIAANVPNSGVYNWTVPALAAGTDYTIKVVPLDSAGTAHGTAGVSGTFTASGTADVLLVSPPQDLAAAAGGTLDVAWVAALDGTPVDVQLQTDGGDWTTLAAGVTLDHTTVTLPDVDTAAARIRVVDDATGTSDTQDGLFRISGTPAVAVAAASVAAGSLVPITWTSPAGTATATIQYYDGTAWQPIATDLPDVGHFDWIVPGVLPTTGSSVRVTFDDASGNQTGTATSGTFDIVTPTTSTATTTGTTTTGTTATGTATPTPTTTTTLSSTVVTAGQATLAVDTATAFPSASAASLRKLRVQFLSTSGPSVAGRAARAVNGTAAISTAKLHVAGTYTLVLTDAAGDTTDQTITVWAGAAAKVAFTAVPATLDSQSAVSIRLTDRFGNATTAADGTTVVARLAHSSFGKGAALAGTTTATVAAGTAKFADLSITAATVTAGRGRLIVTDGKLSSPASAPFAA